MSPIRPSKRPAPEAYDHLWQLLPVFAVFFAIIVFAAANDDRPNVVSPVVNVEQLPARSPDGPSNTTLVSVPSAAAAMERLTDETSEAAATF